MGNDDPRKEVPMTAELIEDPGFVRMPLPQGREWTWADLQEIPDDNGHRYEIVDGSLYVSPGPSRPHQVAASRLVRMLADAAPDHVEVLEAVDVEMPHNVFQPDVVVLPAELAYAFGGPLKPDQVLLAAEVVSPSSRRLDRMVKPSVLAEHGVQAYWRVELTGPGTPAVVMHELSGAVYREVVTVSAGESVLVDVPFPVELRPAELAGPRRSG
jgi:Uma2 family endonuclease